MQPAVVRVEGRTGAGLLDTEDAQDVGRTLEPDTSALLLVFENTWVRANASAPRPAPR